MTAVALIGTIRICTSVLEMILLARIFVSFIPVDQDHFLYKWLLILTEPYLTPLRTFIERRFPLPGFIDWSILAALLLVDLIEAILITVIRIVL